MAATLKDVAERAKVSTSAVSRTFTDGASVSAKMRDKVEKAAKELGYSPNFLARSLTTRRTRLIGLVCDNFHNPLFLEVYDRFSQQLQERGLRPLLVNMSGEQDFQKSIQMLQQYSVDGVVVASSTLPATFAESIRAAGVPVVNSFGRFSTSPIIDIIGIDNVECGRMAARELVKCGYKKVAFMGGPDSATSTLDRHAGFVSEMTLRPDIQTSFSFAAKYTFEAGRAEMLRILDQGEAAEAYFCGDDVLSIGALSAIRERGLLVPNDIGIIGLNDMELAGWQNIDLTTIKQPIKDIVTASIDLIDEIIQNPDRAPESRLFPCAIVRRGTLRHD